MWRWPWRISWRADPGLGLTVDDFPILATDISCKALATAREGRYSPRN